MQKQSHEKMIWGLTLTSLSWGSNPGPPDSECIAVTNYTVQLIKNYYNIKTNLKI